RHTSHGFHRDFLARGPARRFRRRHRRKFTRGRDSRPRPRQIHALCRGASSRRAGILKLIRSGLRHRWALVNAKAKPAEHNIDILFLRRSSPPAVPHPLLPLSPPVRRYPFRSSYACLIIASDSFCVWLGSLVTASRGVISGSSAFLVSPRGSPLILC